MSSFIRETHTCTTCKVTIHYTNIGSWYNAKTKINKTGKLNCQHCAGEIGRANSKIKPTGRPRGSKNGPNIVAWNIGLSEQGVRLNNSLTFEQRMEGIAKRNGYATYEEYKASLPAWKSYKLDVWRVTKRQTLEILENFELRGVNGQEGAYTLDHIISIKKGFTENIPAEEIGDISNLEMLPWEENITKGWK